MDWIQDKQCGAIIGAVRHLALALVIGALTTTSAARAQFLCPPLEGDAAGLDLPASTVTISVIGETGVLGGVAPVRTTMADSVGNVASIFFDICFDATKLDIAEELQSTGAPCEEKADCPGAQACGEDHTCQANVVTACSLADDLGADHILIASSPEIPENPDNPRRLRLLIADATRMTTTCTTAETDCATNEICPFGHCIRTCSTNDDCPSGNRCKALNDGSEQMVCSPLNIIPDGDLVNCTFDVAEDPTIAGTTPLTFGLLQVADDTIPSALAIPAVGVPGSINLVACQNDNDCPNGKVCSPDGVCRVPTPSPTPTITPTGQTATPTFTRSPTTVAPNTPTFTVRPPTITPTNTLPVGVGTLTPTRTPTVTTPTLGTGTATPTRTATGVATGTVVHHGGGGGCNCAIQPAQDADWIPTLFPLLIPAAMWWGRRRRL